MTDRHTDLAGNGRTSTIKDVAQIAGVSTKTVSRVLNGERWVATETRDRIMSAMSQVGFRPNQFARNLRAADTGIFALVTDEIATTPFAVDILRGAQEAARECGRMLLIADTEGHDDVAANVVDQLHRWQVDGLIYATAHHREVILPAEFRVGPCVLADCYSPDHDLPSVVPDEVQGGYTATARLVAAGHRRIGFINGPADFPASSGRKRGYEQALAEHGLDLDESLIVTGDWWQESGYDATRTLLSLGKPPSAVFCGNDWMAMGAYDAIRDLGLSIPGDVAVVGFDDRRVIAAHMRPGLSSVALPYYEMGKWAVRYLNDPREAASDEQPRQAVLECPFIERASI